MIRPAFEGQTAAGGVRPFAARLALADWDRLTLLLLCALAGLVLVTFADYGVTWDEDVHHWYGVLVLDYYLSGLRDLRCLGWLDLYHYGAAFDGLAALLDRVSPLGTYETRHLFNGLVGVLGIAGAGRLGRALGGPRAGFLAALLLLATPNYYGQMFNNPKDIPFAVGMIWAVYYIIRIIPALPRPKLRLVVKLGAATGLALGVRVGGLLLLCYLALVLAADLLWRLAEERDWRRCLGAVPPILQRVVLPTLLVAYPVMLVFWPWAQVDPIANPLRALAAFSHEIFPWTTLFAGRYVPAGELPWSYLPTYIALALPELTLVLLLAAPIVAFPALRGVPPSERRHWVLRHALLAFAILFPVCYAIAVRAVLFDGMRHFIFALPLIAVVAALAAEHLIKRLRSRPERRAVYAGLGLYGLAHVAIMAMLHPNEYVYYNGFVGGVEGAQGLFKLDYWANSYAEDVGALADYLRATYGRGFATRRFTVAVCGPPISADYFFPRNFLFSPDRQHADFFIAFTKDGCDKSLPGREIYHVERMGAVLSVVLDRRSLLAPAERDVSALARRLTFQ